MALTLAIIAIVISFVSFGWSVGWSIYQHRQTTRARLYVKASYATVINPAYPPVPVLDVTVTNSGVVPLTLTSVVADVKGVSDKHLGLISWLYQSKPLPLKLDPGESWSGHYDPDAIREGAASLAPGRSKQKVTFVARDAASRSHEGNSLDF